MHGATEVERGRVRRKGRHLECPFCPDSDWVRQTRLQWYDSLLWAFGIRPFVCLQCWRRFYALRKRN